MHQNGAYSNHLAHRFWEKRAHSALIREQSGVACKLHLGLS